MVETVSSGVLKRRSVFFGADSSLSNASLPFFLLCLGVGVSCCFRRLTTYKSDLIVVLFYIFGFFLLLNANGKGTFLDWLVYHKCLLLYWFLHVSRLTNIVGSAEMPMLMSIIFVWRDFN